MARLGNPLIYDLLAVADGLALQAGPLNLRKTSMRRAVSSAYYGAFHALCFICASEFVGWNKTGLIEPVYRMLDHGTAKNRLTGKETAGMAPEISDIGTRFKGLQEARHAADYSTPALTVRRNETLNHITNARRIVELIESLGSEDRLKLAILLITKAR